MPQSNFWPFEKCVDNADYNHEASVLQKQLMDMEREVNTLKKQLTAIRREPADFLVTKNEKEFASSQSTDDERSALKLRIRDITEENEELKITLNEKEEELQVYRTKYLQAQQEVEELKRQMSLVEYDNKQVSDQIQIDIQKMKMQFQEKLHELSPLPDLLKGAQIQLQEAKQMQKIAEESTVHLSTELNRVKEKLMVAVNAANQEKNERHRCIDDIKHLKGVLDEKNKEIANLTKILDDYKCKLTRVEEKLKHHETDLEEKSKECFQLVKDLAAMRDENSRSLTRCKERADSTKKFMQTQISELERQLVQTRAHCNSFQKERDEIRQRMQAKINNLQENFEMAEIRLKALQKEVSALKSSYSLILGDDGSETNIMVADQIFYTST